MDNLVGVLISLCGFAGVCCGASLLSLFLLVRVMGRSVLIPLVGSIGGALFGSGGLGNLFGGGDDDDVPSRRSDGRTSASDRIQARIQSANQDFDRNAGGNSGFSAQSAPRRNAPPPAPRTPDPNNPFGAAPSIRGQGSRSGSTSDPRKNRRDKDEYEDQIFGGFLDIDGDGHSD